MGDPLSVAASVAGLVSLAGSIIKLTYRYGNAVHHAEAEIRALAHEVAALYGVLCGVQFVARQLEEEGAGLQATRFEHIRGCFAALNDLNNVLIKHAPPIDEQKKAEKWKRKLLYPFSKTKVKEWTGEIERWKSLMTLALSSDSIFQLQELLSSQHAIAEDVREVRLALQRREDYKIERKMNLERKQLLNSLDVDARRNVYDRSCSIRCPGTGNWLLRDDPSYQDWLENPTPILWLRGIVGSGKTILVSAMVTEFEVAKDVGIGLAYFFCTYSDAASQNPQKILAALAKQLAEQNEQAFEELISFFDRFRSYKFRHEFLALKDLEQLMLDICAPFQMVRIVVDGIEECDKAVIDILDSLCSIKEHCKSDVALIISSRSEEQFKPRIGRHIPINIAATSEDLRLYVWTEVTERSRKGLLRINDDLRDEICERLVEKANGMFQWVACQIDYLCELQTAKEHREALDSLPLTLREAYERILLKLVSNKPSSVQMRIRRTLTFINWSCVTQYLQRFDHVGDEVIQGPYIPFSGPALCEAVSLDEGHGPILLDAMPSVEDLLRCCGSLVRRSKIGHGDLEFSHFTVKEYLTQLGGHDNTELSGYAVTSDPKLAYAELVEHSLKYLRLDEFASEQPAKTLSDLSLDPEYRSPSFEGDPFAFRETAVRSIWDSTAAFATLAEEDNHILLLTAQLLEGDTSQAFAQYTLLLYRFSYIVLHEYRKGKQMTSGWYRTLEKPAFLAAMLGSPQLCDSLYGRGNGCIQEDSIEDHMICAVGGRRTIANMVLEMDEERKGWIYCGPRESRAQIIAWILDFANLNNLSIGSVTERLSEVGCTGDLKSLAVLFEWSKSGLTRALVDTILDCVQVSTDKDIGSREDHLFALRKIFATLTEEIAESNDVADRDLLSRIFAVQKWLASPETRSRTRAAIGRYLVDQLGEDKFDPEEIALGGTSEPQQMLLELKERHDAVDSKE